VDRVAVVKESNDSGLDENTNASYIKTAFHL